MASRAAAMKYSGFATYGSEAYDLDRVPSYFEEVAQPGTRTRERVHTGARTRTAVKAQPVGVSLTAVLGVMLAAVLLVCVLLSYVQLAEISGTMGELETQITELNKANKRLTIEYEKAFNLAAVEDYAMNNLNMTKLSDSQIIALNVDRNDKAEILAQPDAGQGLLSETNDFISSMVAYFK